MSSEADGYRDVIAFSALAIEGKQDEAAAFPGTRSPAETTQAVLWLIGLLKGFGERWIELPGVDITFAEVLRSLATDADDRGQS